MRGSYTLIITEKPTAAARIAKALDIDGKPEKKSLEGVPYFTARGSKDIVVVSALGHLYTVTQKGKGRNYYPVFDFRWAPRHVADRKAGKTKAWIEAISKLAEGADEFINSCDYDIEGSLIGYTVLKYACGGMEKSAKRMKFSTMTKRELLNAYSNPSETLDFPLVNAGKARHEIDWLYGINLSRALTLSAKRWSGRYSTISTGRVQGPTLKFLYDREKEIRSFVPIPYWGIKAKAEIKGRIFDVDYEKDKFERRAEALDVKEACKGKVGRVLDISVKKYRLMPPIPFDLGGLQREAYSLFRYTPRRTSGIAERLYLEALISYPRTSSQKLPPAINYRGILEGLRKSPKHGDLAAVLLEEAELKPREGKKEDPAHPAVYPTGNLPERALSNQEKRIWDLVVRRFMATFGRPAVKESGKITIGVGDHRFFLRGKRLLESGWTVFYAPFIKGEDVPLPPVSEGEVVFMRGVVVEDKFTHPQARFNPASLLKKMETEGIGTKATRANIIETLYSRGYIKDERITVTEIGFDVIDILQRHCPRVISVEFTRNLEGRMEEIANDDGDEKAVLIEAVEYLKPILEGFKSKEETIGKLLSEAIKRTRMKERMVGGCPTCGTGTLMILYSKRTRKRFIGCTNYFKGLCETSFPLPQRGTVKPLNKPCSHCGWPLLAVRSKVRRPWNLCFNPKCPSKEGKK